MTLIETPPQQDTTRLAAVDQAIRAAGVLVSILAAVVTAVAELYLTPLRIGGVPIGAAVLVAAAANWSICWFVLTTTGRRWALAPPWVVWTIFMLVAAGVRTTEGDYLLAGGDWVAMVMILVGSLTFAVFAYRAILGSNVVNGGS